MAIGTGTALAIGGGLLGAFAGSQKKGGGTTTNVSEPWKAQQPYLTYGFDKAKDAVGKSLENPVYTGDRVADQNPYTSGVSNQAGDYANRNFANLDGMNSVSAGLVNAGAGFGQNAADLYKQYSGDPTQQIIDNANQYANNPYVDGIIDASSRDVTRNLYENQLPTLAKAATGSGNTNSTRAGVENAVAMRGAGDRLADISNSIRGQFFGKGLDMSQNQYNQNLSNSLNANRQLSDSFSSGFRGLTDTQNIAGGMYNLGTNAGNTLQGQQQREIDADMAKFAEERDIPLDLVKRYMSTIGGSYGGTSTSTAPESGGGILGGIQGAIGGAMGGYGISKYFGANVPSTMADSFGSSGNSVGNISSSFSNWRP